MYVLLLPVKQTAHIPGKKLKPFFAFSYTFSIFSRILNVYPVANFGFWAKMCPKFFGRPKKNKNRGVRPITHTKYFWIWSWHILLLRQSSAFMRLVRVCLQWIQRGNGSVSKLPKNEKLAHGPGLGSQFFFGQAHYWKSVSRPWRSGFWLLGACGE